jgi:hypothetical protein
VQHYAVAGGLTVGVKFQSSAVGYITGIRYYRQQGNVTSRVTGLLYTSAGALLDSATFQANPTSFGWQTVQFVTPVAITANTTYVAAVFNQDEYYAVTYNYFNTQIINSPLSTNLNGGFANPNGVYFYASVPTFPNFDGLGYNFWVDVVFAYPSQPGSLKRVYFKAHP